jgi:hypothetical protein
LNDHTLTQNLEPPWIWCDTCKRVYTIGDAHVIKFASDALHTHPATLTLCPYPDCGAGTTRHGWRWATILAEHPTYPRLPKRDTVYAR